MKIPDKIRIKGIEYDVVDVEDLNDGEKVLYGLVDYGKTLIQLNSTNQKHQYKCVTMWHEIFHAVCEMNGIELGEDSEKIVDAFAFAVYQILEDNKERLFDIDKNTKE